MENTVRVGKSPLTLIEVADRKKLAAILNMKSGEIAGFWVSTAELEAALKQLKAGKKTRSKRCRSKPQPK